MGRSQLLQLRAGTAAQWAAEDPILAADEPGWDTTNGILKIGDGVTPWSALPELFNGSYAPLAALPIPIPAVGEYISLKSISRSTATLTLDRLHYVPLWIPVSMTLDRIGTELVTAAGTTAVLRLGIYDTDTDTGRPGALLVDAGTVNGATGQTPGATEAPIDLDLEPGLIWLAAAAQGADGASPTWRTMKNGVPILVATPPTGTNAVDAYVQGSVAGALPATAATGSGTTTVAPLLYARRG